MHALRAIDELPMNECRKGEKKKGKTTNEKVKKGKRRSADQENLVPHDLESHVDDDQDDPPPELELSIGIFQLPSRRMQGDAEHPTKMQNANGFVPSVGTTHRLFSESSYDEF